MTTSAVFLAIGLLAVPEVKTNCETNKVLEIPGATLDGEGMCSQADYARCVTACVDEALPWRLVSRVGCFYDQRSRSYAVTICECHYVSDQPPIGGHRLPPDVGMGL